MLGTDQVIELRLRESRDSITAHYLLEREVAFIEQFFANETRPKRVLEVCCGSGSVAHALQGTISGLIGLDINRLALVLFRQQSEKTPLIVGDALQMPLDSGSVDCILAIHCLDYLNRPRFIEECSRVLADGSLLIFEASNRSSYKWVLKSLQHSIGMFSSSAQNAKWINIFNCKELMWMVTQNGFELLRISGYNWIPFRRNSNHRLVNIAARIERFLKLDGCYKYSPNILLAVRKAC